VPQHQTSLPLADAESMYD